MVREATGNEFAAIFPGRVEKCAMLPKTMTMQNGLEIEADEMRQPFKEKDSTAAETSTRLGKRKPI